MAEKDIERAFSLNCDKILEKRSIETISVWIGACMCICVLCEYEIFHLLTENNAENYVQFTNSLELCVHFAHNIWDHEPKWRECEKRKLALNENIFVENTYVSK